MEVDEKNAVLRRQEQASASMAAEAGVAASAASVPPPERRTSQPGTVPQLAAPPRALTKEQRILVEEVR